VHSIHVDEAVRTQLTSSFAPVLVNAFELCLACCRNVGHDLSQWLGVPSDGAGIIECLADDFVGLIKNDSRILKTCEARQLRELKAQLPDFQNVMKPFRVRSWWG
jgi:hypothetical protein